MTIKKRILIITGILILGVSIITGTIAYFTDEETAHNVITSGGVSIQLVEKTVDESGAEVDWVNDEIGDAMPGIPVVKKVSISNVGASPAWVRISIEESVISSEGKELPLQFGDNADDVIILGLTNSDKWTYSEGYYYYMDSVPASGSTATVIESVTLAPGITNEYQNCTIYINVNAQAVQTQNNGSTSMEAAGWPAENN